MEKSDKVYHLTGDFFLSVIGALNAIRDLVESDAAKNRALGEAIYVDSTNPFVQSGGCLVATIGINEVVIIDTADALF